MQSHPLIPLLVLTHIGKWRESRFMQIMLSKGLDNIYNNAPKFQRVAHERSEAKTAPPAATRRKRPQAPQKPKTAASKKESPSGDPLMEDFKFETPPVTPPPEKVPVVANTASKDKEFWNFYDKGDNEK